MKPVLVRDLALEHWPSMDRYADALVQHLPGVIVPDAWSMNGPRYLTRYWRYPRALRHWTGDLVHVVDHSYAHCLRAFPGIPSVVTIHDLYPLRVLAESPRSVRGRVRDALLRWVMRWLARADRVIVSTRWAADEVQRFVGTAPDRIHVIPFGIDHGFAATPPPDRVAARRAAWLSQTARSEGARIVLHVGSCAPRKNVEAAIGAVAELRARGVDAILVQIGGRFSGSQKALAHATGTHAVIIQEPAVTDEALALAYHAADVLVLPSSFEGFGLPAVEAMAAGLPVVTSGAGGLREAVGDGAVVTGTLDAASFAEAVRSLLADGARRAELVERGRVVAGALTWERTADLTRQVYERLVAA